MPYPAKKPHPSVIVKALEEAKTVAGAARKLKATRTIVHMWMKEEGIVRECRWIWTNAAKTDQAETVGVA